MTCYPCVRNGPGKVARERYCEALDLYTRTITSRPHDQFPHYQSAVLHAKLGEWTQAKSAFDFGHKQPGAVKEADWDRLEAAIDARDPAALPVVA